MRFGKKLIVIMARKRSYRFRKTREVVLFIYEYRCQLCGSKSFENHVHHLNGNADDNDVYNLTVLCQYHHKLVHRGVQLNFPPLTEFQGRQLYLLSKLWD